MKIKSISDVITNSSSECFTCKFSGMSFSEVKEKVQTKFKELKEQGKLRYTGMGGLLEIKNWEDMFNCWKSYQAKGREDEITTEIWKICCGYPKNENVEKYIWIDMDEGFAELRDWILKTLYVFEVDDVSGFLKNEEGRYVEYNPDKYWEKCAEE